MKNKVVLLSSFFGNALEFYDFTLYGVFAPVLNSVFFPSSNPTLSIVASWAAFSAALFMRPAGALVFGYIGDLWGRKRALSLSILLMAFPTLIIALLPSYSDIGIFSPLALIFCRLIQGLAMGGEYNGSAIFALEHFENKKPGLIGGIITSSGAFGALIATYIGGLAINYDFAWRLPFLLGGMAGLLIVGFRFLLQETPAYLEEVAKSNQRDVSFRFIYNNYKVFFANFSIGALNGCLAYTLFGFSIMYLNRYCSIELHLAIKYNMIGLFFFMLFNPVAGIIFDLLEYIKYFYIALFSTILLVIPIFILLQSKESFYIVCGFIILGILTATVAGPCHAFLQAYIPTNIRYRSVAFSFSLGMGIIGGATPTILTIIMEYFSNLYTPAYFILIIASIFYLFTKIFINSLTIKGFNYNTSSILGE